MRQRGEVGQDEADGWEGLHEHLTCSYSARLLNARGTGL